MGRYSAVALHWCFGPALAAIGIALVASLALPNPAGAAVFPGPKLDLYVDGSGAFNLAVPGDPEGLFEDGAGPGISPGQAGLAIYAEPVGASVGIGQPTAFEPVSPPEEVLNDSEVRVVQTEFLVRTTGVEPSPVLEVLQTIQQLKTSPAVAVTHTVSNAWGDNVQFRPYLVGNLTLDPTNSASATWAEFPVPTLRVASTTSSRGLTLIDASLASEDLFDASPTSVRFGSWADVAQGPPGSGDAYGVFDGATRTAPAFGFEWDQWWLSTLGAESAILLQTVYRLDDPQPDPEPRPQRGVTAVARPVKGTILIKRPGGRYEALEAGESIPVGSLVDTRKGTVRLTTSKGGGVDQSAIFKYGVFRLQQKKASALTTLRIKGPVKSCRKVASRSIRFDGATPRAPLSGRSLWGKGKGKFKTSGKRGSGSVRGTTWQVTDRCDGSTLIKSIQGVVEARDSGKGRNFKRILRSGESYVAKPRR